MKIKTCKTCGISKSVNEFETREDSRDGYRQQCKVCKKTIQLTRKPSGPKAITFLFGELDRTALTMQKGEERELLQK